MDTSDDRVMATVQKLVMSFNTPKEVRDDMLTMFNEAEKFILQWEEAYKYLDALGEILELIDDLTIQANSEVMDCADSAIQMAMSHLEDEFVRLLILNTVLLDAESLYLSVHRIPLSFLFSVGEIDESVGYHERGVSLGDDVCVDLINPGAVIELKEIADRMVRFGYEKECCLVYSSVRSDALGECLVILGFETLSIEELEMIDSNALDEKMKKWVQAVKVTVRVLLTGEKKLCDQIFNESDSVRKVSFKETVKGCIVQLLNFGEAVCIMRLSYDKLFMILNMYEALADVMPDLEEMMPGDFVVSEAREVLTGLGVTAKAMFAHFEDAVKSEASMNSMTGCEVHPLTQYVMNYMELITAYSDTLNSLLEAHTYELNDLQSDNGDSLLLEDRTPIGLHLVLWLSYLESSLEEKSRHCEDGGMQYIFLMNNILYIVQKVKGSDLGKLLGDLWVRKHRGLIRQHATSYLRASWSKVLSCLNVEGTSANSGNGSMLALKEMFKNFNVCFEELYMTQTSWKVPDPHLKEELRISISEQVLPVYRSFVGRFESQLKGGRHAEKYVKYSPVDLEKYFLDLFEGSGGVLPRRNAAEDGSSL